MAHTREKGIHGDSNCLPNLTRLMNDATGAFVSQELVLSIKDLTLSLRSAVPPVPYLHFKLVFRPRAVLVDWLGEEGL